MEESARAVPDVLVAPGVECGPEVFGVAFAHKAPHAVRADEQVAVGGECVNVGDLGAEFQFDSQLRAALLQNVEQSQSRDAGEVVPAHCNTAFAQDNVHVVPRLEAPRNAPVRNLVGLAQVRERAA